MNQTIDTTAIVNALTNHDVKTTVEKAFYKLLADRFRGELHVKAVDMLCMLFLHDVRTGVDGYTGQPLKGLRDVPPIAVKVMFVEAKQIILKNVPDDIRATVERALGQL